jgi:hypothetical protein
MDVLAPTRRSSLDARVRPARRVTRRRTSALGRFSAFVQNDHAYFVYEVIDLVEE